MVPGIRGRDAGLADMTGTNGRSNGDATATVEGYFRALAANDLRTAGALLDDNVTYQNVGYPTLRGSKRVMRLFAAVQRTRMRFDVTIHRTAADGPSVLHERTDVMIFGPLRVSIWVWGVFEVHDGRITLWRDYFDAFDIAKAIFRAVADVAASALRVAQ